MVDVLILLVLYGEDEFSSHLFTRTLRNSLNVLESFRLSSQFFCSIFLLFLRNRKTIIRLTITCHSISEFLEIANNPNLNKNRGSTVRGDRLRLYKT